MLNWARPSASDGTAPAGRTMNEPLPHGTIGGLATTSVWGGKPLATALAANVPFRFMVTLLGMMAMLELPIGPAGGVAVQTPPTFTVPGPQTGPAGPPPPWW